MSTATIPPDPGSTGRFQVEVTITAPPDVVWSALRERHQVRHWHGWDAAGQDAEVDQIYFDGVEADDTARRLVVGGGDTFELFAADGGTRVRLTRAARDPDDEWDRYYEDINEGWTTFLQQLRLAVERHRGEVRRTVYLDGVLVPSGGEPGAPLDALGLAAEATMPPGSRYETGLVGATERGTVWFRSAHQLGLTVDGWGDGLLVVGATDQNDVHPEGAVMGVLSTYGLDDAAVDELESRWTAWWGARYQAPPGPAADS